MGVGNAKRVRSVERKRGEELKDEALRELREGGEEEGRNEGREVKIHQKRGMGLEWSVFMLH